MNDVAGLLAVLKELQELYDLLGETYKSLAYGRAVTRITAEADPCRHTDNPADCFPWASAGLLAKIREFYSTGRILELDRLRASPEVRAYMTFGRIKGVGPSTIKKWLSAGVSTLQALRAAISSKKIVLNHIQKLGLRYYDDLNTRMPRAEAGRLESVVKSVLLSIDQRAVVEQLGSYRRGAATCGDVDVAVTSHKGFNAGLLPAFMVEIQKDPMFVDILSAGGERVSFLYKSTTVRQVDILHVPLVSFYPAVLYFTGSWSFNEAMRGYAKSHGYRLNQHGLYKYRTVRKQEKLVQVPVNSEQDIFDVLGLVYVEPTMRNEPRILVAGGHHGDHLGAYLRAD
jgi:DNA polymerase/3'-5' exonuclease PolX